MTAVRLAVTAHRLAKHGHRSEIHDRRLLPVVERQPEWMAYGLCAQTDPEVFYPEKGGSTKDAKAICRAWFTGPYFAVYGEGGGKGSVTQWQAAMGIDWTADRKAIAEAIPPAYTEFIGRQMLDHLAERAA